MGFDQLRTGRLPPWCLVWTPFCNPGKVRLSDRCPSLDHVAKEFGKASFQRDITELKKAANFNSRHRWAPVGLCDGSYTVGIWWNMGSFIADSWCLLAAVVVCLFARLLACLFVVACLLCRITKSLATGAFVLHWLVDSCFLQCVVSPWSLPMYTIVYPLPMIDSCTPSWLMMIFVHWWAFPAGVR